jgi:predicted AlkP superfamily pyrophosphatase or phosphodiesterase
MIKLLRSWGVVVAALLLVCGAIINYGQAQGAGKTTRAARPEYVILISVDGMPPDYYIAPEKLGLRVPMLTMMKQNGVHAEGMEGVYPTGTYPQHTTMVTGLRPGAL